MDAFQYFTDLLLNNGIGVVCIIYFMFRDYHFMQKLTDALATLSTSLECLDKTTKILEDRYERRSERRTTDHDN